MPKVYLLKKVYPDGSIWKHRPEDDFVRLGRGKRGRGEEERCQRIPPKEQGHELVSVAKQGASFPRA